LFQEGFQSEAYFQLAEEISDELSTLHNMTGEVVIDDRTKFSIGRRIYEASRIGYPYIVALGKKVNKMSLFLVVFVYIMVIVLDTP
jgi:prolyl-tRNA synthetase